MKRKIFIRTVAIIAAATMVLGVVAPVFAETTDTTTVNKDEAEAGTTKDAEILYEQAGAYTVTIPKIIILDAEKQSNYSVKVEGDIGTDEEVRVAPMDSIGETDTVDFYMKDQSSVMTKDDVIATVTHTKTKWSSEEVAAAVETTDNGVSADDLTSGSWEGTFTFEISKIKYEPFEITYDNVQSLGINTVGDVNIPEKLDYNGGYYAVTSLGEGAFSDFEEMQSVVVPNSVRSIGAGVFYTRQISSITLSENLESIGNQAFHSCTNLSEIILPEGLKSIGEKAFYGTGLTSISIPGSVSNMGSQCFSDSLNLESVVINDGVTTIPEDAFNNCRGLKTINIPVTVTGFGDASFANCISLQTVTFGGTEAQWNAIEKGSNWNSFWPDTVQIIYNGEGA